VVCGILGGGYPPWALSLLELRGGFQMPISKSIRVTCVALEIRRIDVLFVGSSVCHFGAGYTALPTHIQFMFQI